MEDRPTKARSVLAATHEEDDEEDDDDDEPAADLGEEIFYEDEVPEDDRAGR